MRARFYALTATGGKGAVRKSIEKKQKKIIQKEKKSRPFGKGGTNSEGLSLKRTHSWRGREEAKKRRKVE
jgi:ribosomal RNA-processing protein 36